MAVTPREKLLSALQHDDLEWYNSILSDYQYQLEIFIDSKSKNFFHDLCNSILYHGRLQSFFLSLHKTIQASHNKTTSEYLNSRAKIDDDEYTPLHFAIVKQKKDLVLMMISHGANYQMITKRGFNCLHLAGKGNSIAIFVVLYEKYSFSLNSVSSEGQNALQMVTLNKNWDLAYLIIALSQKEDLDFQDMYGRTSLHYAVMKEKRKIVKYLLLRGADPLIQDLEGKKPIDLSTGFADIDKLLKRKKIRTNGNKRNFYIMLCSLLIKFIIICWITIIKEISNITKLYYVICGYLLFPITIFFWILASKTKPEIEKLNELSLSDLYCKYVPNVLCPYCKCVKRNKHSYHCFTCNMCIKDYDHHCYWVNNCIGKGNIKYFLLALFFLVLDFTYSIIICILLYTNFTSKNAIGVLTSIVTIASVFFLLAVAPFFYLNMSNFLNSTSVHQKFSNKNVRRSLAGLSDVQDTDSMLIQEDPLDSIREHARDSESSEISKFNSLNVQEL
ncbi:hypothetical protein SteCoe_26791 [Stentor coeruleus]|uniref:Palmitoyltransferase n=1 Tax=Stentor coeruleus TaxID=5963 RepID=A0A1R2BC21_9CILI|nr:hypothetical protein SteCoe_26791 [Stentor coeruleus]